MMNSGLYLESADESILFAAWRDAVVKDVISHLDFGGTQTLFIGKHLFFFVQHGLRIAVLACEYESAAMAAKTMVTVGED